MPDKSTHEPAPDDVKARMRQALEAKRSHGGADVSETAERSKVDHAQGPAGGQRMFRRKSG